MTREGSSFDVLGPLMGDAAVNDWVVVGNQGVADAYADDVNRAQITALAANPGGGTHGTLRITHALRQFPQGYAGGRFVVVPNAEQAVFFVCANAGTSNGNGTGTLVRQTRAFTTAYPTTCPAAGGEVLATGVSACNFTQEGTARSEYGLMTLSLALTRNGETVALRLSQQLSNLP